MEKLKQLLYNSAICLNCGEVLVSYHTHDYKVCGCENETMVDGGESYQRYGGKNLDLVQPHCIYDTDSFETIRFYVSRGGRGINGDEPLKYVKLKDIDDEWLANIISYEEQHRPTNKFLPIYKKEVKYRKKKEL